MSRRQALVEEVRALKKEDEAGRAARVSRTMKSFQVHVDWLTARALFAEDALANVVAEGLDQGGHEASRKLDDANNLCPPADGATGLVELAEARHGEAAALVRVAELEQALSLRDTEIETLRQRLAAKRACIDVLKGLDAEEE